MKEREKVKEKEDLSDMVAEHAAKKVLIVLLSILKSNFQE